MLLSFSSQRPERNTWARKDLWGLCSQHLGKYSVCIRPMSLHVPTASPCALCSGASGSKYAFRALGPLCPDSDLQGHWKRKGRRGRSLALFQPKARFPVDRGLWASRHLTSRVGDGELHSEQLLPPPPSYCWGLLCERVFFMHYLTCEVGKAVGHLLWWGNWGSKCLPRDTVR